MPTDKQSYDVIIIGAGAAGLFCAIHAAKSGLTVAVLEKNQTIAQKIRVSGGGRCNMTNLNISPDAYLSNNPHFCRAALARYTQWDFLNWCRSAGLDWQEKTLGQLFCRQKSRGVIDALQTQCDANQVSIHTNTNIKTITGTTEYIIHSNQGTFSGKKLVLACGGPSFAKLGGSDFALRIAKQFNLANIPFRPALVPLTLPTPITTLSGVSTEVIISSESAPAFRDALLFTHRGLSGPAVLQISSYWQKGNAVNINFLPDITQDYLCSAKQNNPRQTPHNALQQQLPKALITYLLQDYPNQSLQQYRDKKLKQMIIALQHWRITPNGSEGMSKAEVSTGGIDTRAFNPKTFEAKTQAGLYAIGEALDVTGWLGGYNFQWAWSSAWCCAQALCAACGE